MFVINNRRLAQEKVDRILQGYSAYAESKELAYLIKKELEARQLPFFEDRTEIGYWFIPEEHPSHFREHRS
ncbi:hypothetical protein [Metabacillus arenae]|uniref:Uncharacterized protein n=1 Tax=Metabacillus arenae TaxID=2771434 RepID=A0A926RWZ7_9BACI|nr:hypothetical protein [Metabacillus arenae]MBD1380105.1 hypothetical protein [Metabacillus arenae]